MCSSLLLLRAWDPTHWSAWDLVQVLLEQTCSFKTMEEEGHLAGSVSSAMPLDLGVLSLSPTLGLDYF